MEKRHQQSDFSIPVDQSRLAHDNVFMKIERPRWLLDGDLVDDLWTVRTEDSEGCRKTDYPFDFSAVIAPKAVALNSQVHLHDLITAKLYIIYGLDRGEGWTSSARSAHFAYRDLLTFIRWREEVGLRRMSELGPVWFRLLKKTVSERDRLFPFEKRVANFVRDVREGRAVLPVSSSHKRLRWNDVAAQLGFVSTHQIPNTAWQPLFELLEETHPKIHREIIRKRLFISMDDEDQELVPERLVGLLQPWQVLWKLRHRMQHDAIQFNAFGPADRLTTVAKSLTKKRVGKVLAPPSYQFCFLVNAALRMLIEHHDLWQKLIETVREATFRYPGSGPDVVSARRLWLDEELGGLKASTWASGLYEIPLEGIYVLRPEQRQAAGDAIDVRTFLFGLLAAACAVVIAAFSARRSGEIDSLRDDCAIKDANGGIFLTCWIEKSARRLDRVPVPMSVIRAVEVLAQLSEAGRTKRRSHWLFEFVDPIGSNRGIQFQFNSALRMFSDYVGVPNLPNGTKWNFQSRQFRTGFSTIYYHRWHYPSLTALSHFLDHYNPDTTRGYVTALARGQYLRIADEKSASQKRKAEAARLQRAKDFEDGRQAFILETARAVAVGETKITGYGGAAWTRDLAALVERSTRSATFASSPREDTLDQLLRDWGKGKWLEPHPSRHSFCACGPGRIDLDAAACLAAKKEAEGLESVKLSRKPDYAYAVDEVCSECPHNAQLPCNRVYWEEACDDAAEVARNGATARQRCNASTRLSRLSGHLDRCHRGPSMEAPQSTEDEPTTPRGPQINGVSNGSF